MPARPRMLPPLASRNSTTAFPAGTDAENNEGYNAAQNAEQQLKLDFLGSFQNPQKNAANQTAWDEEEAQSISDFIQIRRR